MHAGYFETGVQVLVAHGSEGDTDPEDGHHPIRQAAMANPDWQPHRLAAAYIRQVISPGSDHRQTTEGRTNLADIDLNDWQAIPR